MMGPSLTAQVSVDVWYKAFIIVELLRYQSSTTHVDKVDTHYVRAHISRLVHDKNN